MLEYRKIIYWSIGLIFTFIFLVCIGYYLNYISAVLQFSYDWEPTDGDHLNFARRIANGLPIYLPLSSGKILSIYNPLYHGLVAILGGKYASLTFARSISFIFWLAIPVTVFLYYKKKWNYFFAIIAAIFIWLPPEPGMLLEIVQVSPNSTMPFFFLSTLLYSESCSDSKSNYWWDWLIIGALTALTYLAKQQGIIAIPIVIFFLLIRRTNFRNIIIVVFGFIIVFAISTFYLESVNSGQFLNMTLFELNKILHSSYRLAFYRLLMFFIHNLAFTICVLLALFSIISNYKKLSIWHISFILHIPFLFKILGNAGGGITYCLTLWITMVLISMDFIKTKEFVYLSLRPIFKINWRIKFGKLPSFSKMILFCLCINISYGTISIYHNFNLITPPSPKLNALMKNYYHSIDSLIALKPNAKVLTNRNIGMLVLANANIENEGSTLFQYAWPSVNFFNRNLTLESVRNKEYDLITSGIQEYPSDVKKEIDANYKVILINEINHLYGNTGIVKTYIPK
jgi:hypothetical protein